MHSPQRMFFSLLQMDCSGYYLFLDNTFPLDCHHRQSIHNCFHMCLYMFPWYTSVNFQDTKEKGEVCTPLPFLIIWRFIITPAPHGSIFLVDVYDILLDVVRSFVPSNLCFCIRSHQI